MALPTSDNTVNVTRLGSTLSTLWGKTKTALSAKVPSGRKVNGKALSADITLNAADVSAIATSASGVADGVATLGSDGKVPTSQLPAYQTLVAGTDLVITGSTIKVNTDGTADSANMAFVAGSGATANGLAAAAFGIGTSAVGSAAFTLGIHSSAVDGAIALGINCYASGIGAVAEGRRSLARVAYCHAEGNCTTASAAGAHSEGNNTSAVHEDSHAEGWHTIASGNQSHTEGCETSAYGQASHAEGWSAYTVGSAAHAEGSATSACGRASHTEGNSALANGMYSHAEGEGTSAMDVNSHAEGSVTLALGINSHAEGESTIASAMISHAEGYKTTAEGTCSHAEGEKTFAGGFDSHAEGSETSALGSDSHAEGYRTSALFYMTHAEGSATQAGYYWERTDGGEVTASGYSGIASHAEGIETIASSNAAHAEGSATSAVGSASHTEGYETKALSDYSHAEGKNTVVSSMDDIWTNPTYGSHAEGEGTSAFGTDAHAEGCITYASGNYSHAGGYNSKAIGEGSFAHGFNCTAIGNAAFAGGGATIASGDYAYAGGNETSAIGEGMFVIGSYNKTSANAAFVIGNGEYNNKADAFSVDWNGNTYVGGKNHNSAISGCELAINFGNSANKDSTYSSTHKAALVFVGKNDGEGDVTGALGFSYYNTPWRFGTSATGRETGGWFNFTLTDGTANAGVVKRAGVMADVYSAQSGWYDYASATTAWFGNGYFGFISASSTTGFASTGQTFFGTGNNLFNPATTAYWYKNIGGSNTNAWTVVVPPKRNIILSPTIGFRRANNSPATASRFFVGIATDSPVNTSASATSVYTTAIFDKQYTSVVPTYGPTGFEMEFPFSPTFYWQNTSTAQKNIYIRVAKIQNTSGVYINSRSFSYVII